MSKDEYLGYGILQSLADKSSARTVSRIEARKRWRGTGTLASRSNPASWRVTDSRRRESSSRWRQTATVAWAESFARELAKRIRARAKS